MIGLCWLLSALSCGCTYERVVRDSWAETFSEIGGGQRGRQVGERSAKASRNSQNMPGWTIRLTSYEGPDRMKRARQLVERLQREARMPDLWVHDAGDRTMVYRGRYFDPESLPAINDLRQTRMTPLDETQPFSSAQLVDTRTGGDVDSDLGQYDLQRHMGKGLYSLQIRVYDENFGDNFRKQAEADVVKLREEGEKAYYYHGELMSMVTVGLFSYKQAFDHEVGRQDRYSGLVVDLQKRFPHNLYNGWTVVEKQRGKEVGEQPSFLVPLRQQ